MSLCVAQDEHCHPRTGSVNQDPHHLLLSQGQGWQRPRHKSWHHPLPALSPTESYFTSPSSASCRLRTGERGAHEDTGGDTHRHHQQWHGDVP